VKSNAGFGTAQPNDLTWLFHLDSDTNELTYMYQQSFPQTIGSWQTAPAPAPVTPRVNSSISVAQFSTVAF
jgi:hypothetical protein